MSDYATLRADVAEWMDRDVGSADNVVSQIPTFTRLAIDELNRDERSKVLGDQTLVTLPGVDSVYLPLPADYGVIASLKYSAPNQDKRLVQVSIDALGLAWSGRPTRYALHQNQVEFDTALSSESGIELLYWPLLPQLVADTDTNWFLTNAYGVMLYGVLLQSVPFLRDDDIGTAGTWASAYEGALTGVAKWQKERQNSQNLQRRVNVGSTP